MAPKTSPIDIVVGAILVMLTGFLIFSALIAVGFFQVPEEERLPPWMKNRLPRPRPPPPPSPAPTPTPAPQAPAPQESPPAPAPAPQVPAPAPPVETPQPPPPSLPVVVVAPSQPTGNFTRRSPPLAQYIQIALDPNVTKMTPDEFAKVPLFIRATVASQGTGFTGTDRIRVEQTKRLDMRSAVPIERIEFSTSLPGVIQPVYVDLLGSDGKTLLYRETLGEWLDQIEMDLTMDPLWRPAVWDARDPSIPVLPYRDPKMESLRPLWNSTTSPMSFPLIDIAMLHAVNDKIAPVAVPVGLSMFTDMETNQSVDCIHRPCFMVVTHRALGNSAGDVPLVNLVLSKPNGFWSIGIRETGELFVQYMNADNKEVITQNVGPTLSLWKPNMLVVGFQFSKDARTGLVRFEVLHPNGTVYTFDTTTTLEFESNSLMIGDMGLLFEDDEAKAKKPLLVHELRAYWQAPRSMTEQEMLTVRSELISSWGLQTVM